MSRRAIDQLMTINTGAYFVLSGLGLITSLAMSCVQLRNCHIWCRYDAHITDSSIRFNYICRYLFSEKHLRIGDKGIKTKLMLMLLSLA